MTIVRYAKYVGTMIGPEGYVHRWTTPRERFFQRTRKINGTSKCLVKRLIDFKIYALSVLGHWGSISAPDGATLKEEAPALQCTTVGPTIIPTDLLRAGSVCGLGIDQVEIRILNLAARFRTAASSNALASSLQKSVQPESTTVSPCSLSPPEWEEKFLKTPMAHSTMEAYEYARHLVMLAELPTLPAIRNKKPPRSCSATRSKNDFSFPITARASQFLGPISRHLMAQIIPMIYISARASALD